MAQIGKYAFLAGLVLSVVAAFVTQVAWIYWVLAILGLIVGFMNVTSGETKTFLLAAIGLIMSATAVLSIPYIGETVTEIVANLVAFIAAAVLVVALKALFETAKD